jgi:hypothetical protein
MLSGNISFINYVILIFILLSNSFTNSQSVISESKIYGVTIDNTDHLRDVVKSLSKLPKKPTVRIVFDDNKPASKYINAVNRIHEVSYIMGSLADSYYMKNYSVQGYTEKVNEFVNTLGDKVDLWEIGNEVNGGWLGDEDSVLTKIIYGYKFVYSRNKATVLTLYYNDGCTDNPGNEMFSWVNTLLPESMKNGLDYILVSYYEDDCNNLQPDWQKVFDSLHVIFPNSKLGIGECGTTISEKKELYMNRYYNMKITTPGYIGGYFWWYFKEDCVPYTKPLWKVMNSLFAGTE